MRLHVALFSEPELAQQCFEDMTDVTMHSQTASRIPKIYVHYCCPIADLKRFQILSSSSSYPVRGRNRNSVACRYVWLYVLVKIMGSYVNAAARAFFEQMVHRVSWCRRSNSMRAVHHHMYACASGNSWFLWSVLTVCAGQQQQVYSFRGFFHAHNGKKQFGCSKSVHVWDQSTLSWTWVISQQACLYKYISCRGLIKLWQPSFGRPCVTHYFLSSKEPNQKDALQALIFRAPWQ